MRSAPRSGAAGQLGLDGNVQVGLVQPAAGVRRPVPALQGDGADVVAFLVVEDLEKRLGEVGADLGGGATEVKKSVTAVVEDGNGPPALGLRLGLVKHGPDPPWPGCECREE